MYVLLPPFGKARGKALDAAAASDELRLSLRDPPQPLVWGSVHPVWFDQVSGASNVLRLNSWLLGFRRGGSRAG